MVAFKEFANFINLNMANLATTYARLLAESSENYATYSLDNRLASARKLLKAVTESLESQTSEPLSLLFADSNHRWPKDTIPSQPLLEIEALGQTLTPVITDLEAGKFLWGMLAEVRGAILDHSRLEGSKVETLERSPVPGTGANVQTFQPSYEHKPIEEALRESEQRLLKAQGEENRQRQFVESLRQVAIILSSSLDQETVLSRIMEQLRRMVDYDSGAIFLSEGDALILSSGVGVDEAYLGFRIPLSSSLVEAEVFNQKRPLVIQDVRLDPRWPMWSEDDPIRAWMGAPLMVGQEAIGILTADKHEVGAYNEQDAQVLQTFANHASTALHNARLFDEEHRQRSRAEALYQEMQSGEIRYRGLFEDSPISLWEEDFSAVKSYLDTLRQEGISDFRAYLNVHPEIVADCALKVKIVDVNQATLELYKATSKAEFFAGLGRVFGQESFEAFKEELIAITEGQTGLNLEAINHTLSGERKNLNLTWAVAPGYEETLARVLVSIIDITEQKQAEEALREGESRYRGLFEDSPISLWEEDFSEVKHYLDNLQREGVTDLRAYLEAHPETVGDCAMKVKIVGVNRATLELFQASTIEQFFGGLNQIFGQESFPVFQEELITLAEGQSRFESEGINYTLTGDRKDLVIRAFIAPGHEETWSKVLVTMIDITEQKRLDRHIRALLGRRTRQVETSTEVAQEIALAPALDELFRLVVNLIQERFGYYHTHVYTLQRGPASGRGEGQEAEMYLVMQEGTGEAGRKMKQVGHKIALAAERSLVARAARTGEPVLVPDVARVQGWLPNPNLPETKAELAVPIKLGERVLGVLDVQSNLVEGLTQEDQILLMGLCGQIAVAINQRQIETERTQLEERTRLIVDSALDAVISIDAGGFITAWNPQAEAIFGWSQAEVIGQRLSELIIPAEYREGHERGLKRFLATDEGPILNKRIEMTGLRRTGGKFPVELAISAVRAGESYSFNAFARDITERKQTEEALARQAIELETVAQVGVAVATILEPTELLRTVADLTQRRFGLYQVNIYLLHENDSRLELVAAAGRVVQPEMAEGRYISLDQEDALVVRAARTRRPVIVNDVWQSSAIPGPALAETRSEMVLPLIAGDRALGALDVRSDRIDRFTEVDAHIHSTLASQIATALENARLFEQTQRRARELAILNELGQTLAARLSVEQVLEVVYQAASGLTEATNFSVGLYDPDKDEVTIAFTTNESKLDRQITIMPANAGITGYIIRHRTSVLIPENVPERLAELGIEAVGEPAKSFLGVPLIAGDQVLGWISVQSFTTPRLYSQHDQELLQAVASQTALAIQNARQFEQTQAALVEAQQAQREANSRLRETQILQQLAQTLAVSLEIDDVAQAFFAAARQLLGIDFAIFSLVDEQKQGVGAIAGFNVSADHLRRANHPLTSNDIMAGIIRTGQTELITGDDSGFDPENWGLRIFTPITIRREHIGLIEVGFKEQVEVALHQHHVDLLRSLIDQVAVSLDNARRYQASRETAQREQTLREITAIVNTSGDLLSALPILTTKLQELVDLDVLTLTTYTTGEPDFTLYAVGSAGPESRHFGRRGLRLPVDGTAPGWVIRHNEPWQDEDLRATKPFLEDEQLAAEGMAARLILPLRLGEQVIGTLNMAAAQPSLFRPEHLPLLWPVADQLALALERNRLFDETQRRVRREQTIREITEKMRVAASLEELVKITAEEVGQRFSSEYALVELGIADLKDSHNGN